ncbi:divalent-cation tolerance protein CutA [Candidatus Woesearchaeota archaeon]|nr:divalent-cation tolerance protein CutA [Candidatus Woesearchaeota archaeon]
MRIVYITVKNAGDAKKISHHLLHKRIVACTNIFPIESMFWWNGEIQENVEFVVLAKTTDANYDKVEKEVKEIHEYEVPAIYSWKADKISKDYEKWIKKEIK